MSEQVRATGAVVDFITRARWPEFPADAVALAKRCVIDGLGVMLAGSTSAASTILRDYTRGSDSSTDATAFAPEPFRTGVASAALLNGTSGHGAALPDAALCRGPGNLSCAMGITLAQNRLDLTRDTLFIEKGGRPAGEVAWGPRIGIRVGTDRLWRAWLSGHAAVSRGSKPVAPLSR